MSASLGNLAAALAAFQAGAKPIAKGHEAEIKNREGQFLYRYWFADLTDTWEDIRAGLAAVGLSVMQFPGYDTGLVTMQSMLLHSSGEWVCSPVAALPVGGKNPQDSGTAISYLRRYTLAPLIGIVTDSDDDAAGATEQQRQAAKKQQQRQQEQPKDEPASYNRPADPAPATQKIAAAQRQYYAYVSAVCRQKIEVWADVQHALDKNYKYPTDEQWTTKLEELKQSFATCWRELHPSKPKQ